MQYIDKSANRQEGNALTLAYLHEIEIKDEQRYPVDYDNSFRSLPNKGNSYYRQMTAVLLDNQHHYCCYCMRRISGDGDTTLEHIIPQKATERQLAYYKRDDIPELKNHIILSYEFSHTANPSLTQLPHTVSYDNLVASCCGTYPKLFNDHAELTTNGQSCNNVRGQKDIFPVYLLNIPGIVLYDESGHMFEGGIEPWNDEVRLFISAARLNCSSLQDIRRLWFLLKEHALEEITTKGEDKESRRDFLLDTLYLTDLPDAEISSLLSKFEKDEYWNTFLLYDWFYSIEWDEA